MKSQDYGHLNHHKMYQHSFFTDLQTKGENDQANIAWFTSTRDAIDIEDF